MILNKRWKLEFECTTVRRDGGTYHGAVKEILEMKLATHWARESVEESDRSGKMIRVEARGWSMTSVADATEAALRNAKKIAAKLRSSGDPAEKRYWYGERPLPEPILKEFKDSSGELRAVVTRNGYGALVLNTDDLFIADVDRPAAERRFHSLFGRLFKRKASPTLDLESLQNALAGRAARIYETRGGYRVIVSDRRVRANSSEAEKLLSDLGADPLYAKLCLSQESFRARLTPKPWRCKMSNPSVSFPFRTRTDEEKFADWLERYNIKSQDYSVCRLVKSQGFQPRDDRY